MKKFIVYSLIILILVGGVLTDFGSVEKVEAQCAPGQTSQLFDPELQLYACYDENGDFVNYSGGPLAQVANDSVDIAEGNSCLGLSVFTNIEACFFAIIGQTVLKIMALFLWVTGLLFDFVITETVVDISENFDKITGINDAWEVLRNLANMGFIFLLLYSAIRLIIGLDSEGEVGKTVANIVIIALILNFSLFFTKIVIDATNVVTLGFYNSVSSAELVRVGSTTEISGISATFMRPLGLTDILSTATFDKFIQTGTSGYGIITISLAGSLLFLITGFIFLAASILFISRYIILIMLLILSPLAFVSYAFPKVRDYFGKWWSALVNQTVFPVVFMILVWVALQVFNSTNFFQAADGLSWGSLFFAPNDQAPNSGAIYLLFNFAIVIGFMIFALVVSKDIAHRSGGWAKKVTTGVGVVGLGAAAWAGRSTLGRAGKAVADNEWLKDKAKTSRLAGLALRAGSGTAKSSFDARATRLGKGVGLDGDFGKTTGKGGYAKTLKDQVEKREEFAKSLQPTGAKLRQKLAPKDTELEKTSQSISDINKEIATKEREIKESDGSPEHRAEREREIEKLKTDRSALITTQKNLNRDIENIKAIGKERQLAYSNVLESGLFGLRKANREGAAAVRKLAKGKTNAEKLIEEVEKNIKEESKSKETEPKTEESSGEEKEVA